MDTISRISNELTITPTRYPDCCLAISTTFLEKLSALLPQTPKYTLSIGSGSGLLESLLAHRDRNIAVQGVEVNSTVNRYITEENMHVVNGGWGLCSAAEGATAWMFVYPRDPKLISKYIETLDNAITGEIVWLGPKVDWGDYEERFRRSSFSELTFLDDCGLAPYEIAVVARKS